MAPERLIERLEAACSRAEFEYPRLAAPDGTVAIQITDLRAAIERLTRPDEGEVERALPLIFYDSPDRQRRLENFIDFLRGRAADGRMSVHNVSLLADDLAALRPIEEQDNGPQD